MRPVAGSERREARRYSVALSIDFGDFTGTTRNISEVGVLLQTEKTLNQGDEVEFALVFGEYDPGGFYRVRCAGRVVRVEQQETTYIVAVRLTSYSL